MAEDLQVPDQIPDQDQVPADQDQIAAAQEVLIQDPAVIAVQEEDAAQTPAQEAAAAQIQILVQEEAEEVRALAAVLREEVLLQ